MSSYRRTALRGLTRLVHRVDGVGIGEQTAYSDGMLTVSPVEAAAVAADPALAEVRISWASPGDPVRIVKVLDAVEPRTKGAGGGGIFPGFLAPPLPQGVGETHVLRGAAVVAAGFLPRAQEAVIDMSGPAAPLAPLASTHNLVVEFTPAPGASWEDVDVAVRRAVLALAAWLAEAALEARPDEVEEVPPPASAASGGSDGLPRVGVVTNLQTQGLFKDVFFYGTSFAGKGFAVARPALVDPNELDDGAVVSGQYGHPSLRNPTYLHQNHPVIEVLRRRSGSDLHLAGLVLCPEPVDQEAKELVSLHAARLCSLAGFDGVVLHKEGGGNADADVALKMDALEDLGIAAVGLFAEMAGPDGTGPSVVVPPTKATAMVSTGNYDERLTLPAVERALGGDRLDLLGVAATEEMVLPVAVIHAALSPLGWGRLTCAEVAA